MTRSQPVPTTELIALRVLSTAVRCREVGGGPVTYRKSLANVVAGQRLTVAVERRWTFRKTDMLGGRLLGTSFSRRALASAGFRLPSLDGRVLRSPCEGDGRLATALAAVVEEDWLTARALFIDVLEDCPASLVAHSVMGDVHAFLHHPHLARSHHTAAIRLGLGAARAGDLEPPLESSAPAARALLRSLVGRASVLAGSGRPEAAANDLRRALLCDPNDWAGAKDALLALAQSSRATTSGSSRTTRKPSAR